LTLGSDGFLYGTTYGGGDSLAGTIFKIARDGSEPILLHTFAPGKIVPPLPYGQQPTRQQAMDAADGNLYGTTYAGGPTIRGVVFRLSVDGQYTILHYFGGNASNPVAGLVEVTEDNALAFGPTSPEAKTYYLYGACDMCGSVVTREDTGTLFPIREDGSDFSDVYNFDGTTGVYPDVTPVLARDSNLYGLTAGGGKGSGVFYRLNTVIAVLAAQTVLIKSSLHGNSLFDN
jgi:uncharacterized repeat protein (TIGR03803 family)